MSGREVAASLNALENAAAREALRRCCGASRWVDGMLARRPYVDDDALFAAADDVWWGLGVEDWLEAFAAHPRIGDRSAAQGWSREEQSGIDAASADVAARLRDGNERYERRFGHVFLICAAGRTAGEMLAELKRRVTNDAGTELREAAEEQCKITRLRLRKLVSP